MELFDSILGKCFSAGFLVGPVFAVMLYLSIFLLLLYTLGQTALHLVT